MIMFNCIGSIPAKKANLDTRKPEGKIFKREEGISYWKDLHVFSIRENTQESEHSGFSGFPTGDVILHLVNML